MRRTSRAGFSLIELIVVILIVFFLFGLLFPRGIVYSREAARRSQCRNNLKQLGLAIANYEETHRVYPPGLLVPVDDKGHPPGGASYWHWNTRILPFMELAAIYKEIDHSKLRVHSLSPLVLRGSPAFQCEAGYHAEPYRAFPVTEPGTVQPRSSYAAVHNAGEFCLEPGTGDGLFIINACRSIKDVSDGTSNTLYLGEKSSPVITTGWIWRTQHVLDGASAYCVRWPDTTGQSLSAAFGTNAPLNQKQGTLAERSRGFYSAHQGGAHFASGDASVRWLSDTIDRTTFNRLIAIADGEKVEFPD